MSNGIPVGPQPWRLVVTAIVFAALCGVVVMRLHELQVLASAELSALALRQRARTYPIPAERGSIYDREGRPLAVSVPSWDCFADPGYMDDRLRATVELARILDLPRSELRAHFEARGNGRRLATGLDDAQAAAIRDLGLAGIHLRHGFQRRHPAGPVAPHAVGFVLADGTGGGGIEARFEAHLAGSPGLQTMMVDAYGRPRLAIDAETIPAQPGAHLQLTIDAILQAELEAALAAAIARHDAASGCAVLLRPGSGAVLAMASWPTFDNHDFSGTPIGHFRNGVLGFVYESGSTMKPLTAGAAVAEGLADWDEEVDCEQGQWRLELEGSRRLIKNGHHPHGRLTVDQGIAKSDNVLVAKLAVRLGAQRWYDWLTRLGFGRPTGIALPGEDRGLFPPRERWNMLWYGVSASYGHGIAITPLQMASAHAAVANGGEWVRPRIVERAWRHDAEGRAVPVDLGHGAERRRVFAPAVAAGITAAMAKTMTEGTGRRLQLDGYTSAGKTGTTEKAVAGRYDAGGPHIGSFVGFAPVSPGRQAELLALAVIDEPRKGGHYGSQTAGPVVQHILQFGLEYLRVVPDVPAAEPDGDG